MPDVTGLVITNTFDMVNTNLTQCSPDQCAWH